MYIVFNASRCGLANNGGSRTVIKCCEVLNSLGHRCDIASRADNFTWFKHRPMLRGMPSEADVIIAVSADDVDSTLYSKITKKAWYIRAHETWVRSEKQLSNYYRDNRMVNIVNSKGLQKKIKELGSDSAVIYQGIDFDWWGDRKLRPKDKIRIGCLHTKQKRKRWGDFVKLSKILGTDKYEYVGMGGSNCKNKFLTKFIHNANVEQLNDLYSSCHVWFAPTDNEGLHNVPMEAALCGCLVVCSDHPLNGMSFDYAFDDKTAMVYKFGDLKHAADLIRNPKWSLIKDMQDHLHDGIGNRESNMDKMVEYLERL